MCSEGLGIEKLAYSDTGSGGFVAVAGTDSALGCSDLVVLGSLGFLGTVKKTVVRHDQVCPDIDKKVLVKLFGNSVKLALHGVEVDDSSDSDDANGFLVEDSGRDDVECELAVLVDNGVTRVVTALVSDDDIRICCKIVDYPSLSFIAPLGADD